MGRRSNRRQSALQAFAAETLEPRTCLAAFTLSPVIDTVDEGTAAVFRVALDAPAQEQQSVLISCLPGTATEGADYVHQSETLVFEPGEMEKVFHVQSLADPGRVREGAETLTVVVTPEGDTGQLSAVVTINDFADPSPYNIEFEFDVSVPGSVQSLFNAAGDLWERVIVGDLPDVTLADGRVVDDLLIQVDMADLGQGVIALAGFTDIRDGNTHEPAHGVFTTNGLPYLGQMTINSTFQAAVGLGTTIAHEIGHVIGFGTLWQNGVGDFAELVQGIGTDNPVFVGENAVREFSQIFSTSDGGVPLFGECVTHTHAYDGSYGSHWRDDVFNDYPHYGELMTAAYPIDGDHDGNVILAGLSRVTVGALEDLGYAVNYLGAETYAPFGGAALFPDQADNSGPGVVGPVASGQPTGGDQPGGGEGLPPADSGEPHSLPPRISYPDAAPLILSDTAEARARLRDSLQGYYADELSPINLAHLATDQLARLAAWAEFERVVVWDHPSDSLSRADESSGNGDDDGLFADPGFVA